MTNIKTFDDRIKVQKHVKVVDELLRNGNYEVVDNMLANIELNIATIALQLWVITGFEKEKFKNRDKFRERCIEFFTPKLGHERVQELFKQ